ncbi:MAG TPA: M12 family metallo-peptidase, partial [Thermoanaerobaculia bacterium]|nr:M12 family metallo-peptidase [Thermoanaerobaculia bacterium]
PDSRVFLSAFPGGVHGYVQRGEETFAVEPEGRWGEETPAHVVRRLTKDEWAALAAAFRCDAERLATPAPGRRALAGAAIADTGQAYAATVAVDTDYELFKRFPNAAAERNYVSNELAAVSAIYWRDLKTRLTVGFLRVWTSSADPWSGTDPLSALFQVGDYWHAHGSGTARAGVAFLSGKNLGGGVSWVGTLGGSDFWDSADGHWAGAYAVVGNIEGSLTNFRAPAAGSDVWDIEAIAHELGHTFGSVHTHCYVPPIDECYGGEPGCYSGPNVDPGPGVGTIMSYCHLFGWSEISLKFHSRCVTEQLRPTILQAASHAPSVIIAGLFGDVSPNDTFAPSISTAAAWGIIPGCTATAFCPNQTVSRADVAVFVERGLNVFVPPPNRPQIFTDVPPGAYAYDFIEDFSARKITSGCTPSTFCPSNAVTRAQLAVFLLRMEHGSAYAPPAATGTMFGDVPASAFAAAWIEQLAREGITKGCAVDQFCPNDSVRRNQMAAFLVRALHL